MHGALVTEIDVLVNNQTLRILVRQDSRTGGLGLAHGILRARIIQEAIMDAAGVPGVNPLGAAEFCIADE